MTCKQLQFANKKNKHKRKQVYVSKKKKKRRKKTRYVAKTCVISLLQAIVDVLFQNLYGSVSELW